MPAPRRLAPLTALLLVFLGGVVAPPVRAQQEAPVAFLTLAQAVERYGGARAALVPGDRVLLENSAGALDVSVTLGEIKAVGRDGEALVLETFTWFANGTSARLHRHAPARIEVARFARSIQARLHQRAETLEAIAARTRGWDLLADQPPGAGGKAE